jgi:hypothetical protein
MSDRTTAYQSGPVGIDALGCTAVAELLAACHLDEWSAGLSTADTATAP